MIQIGLRLNSKSEKRPPIPNPTPTTKEIKDKLQGNDIMWDKKFKLIMYIRGLDTIKN